MSLSAVSLPHASGLDAFKSSQKARLIPHPNHYQHHNHTHIRLHLRNLIHIQFSIRRRLSQSPSASPSHPQSASHLNTLLRSQLHPNPSDNWYGTLDTPTSERSSSLDLHSSLSQPQGALSPVSAPKSASMPTQTPLVPVSDLLDSCAVEPSTVDCISVSCIYGFYTTRICISNDINNVHFIEYSSMPRRARLHSQQDPTPASLALHDPAPLSPLALAPVPTPTPTKDNLPELWLQSHSLQVICPPSSYSISSPLSTQTGLVSEDSKGYTDSSAPSPSTYSGTGSSLGPVRMRKLKLMMKITEKMCSHSERCRFTLLLLP